jgi:hypothetical protein
MASAGVPAAVRSVSLSAVAVAGQRPPPGFGRPPGRPAARPDGPPSPGAGGEPHPAARANSKAGPTRESGPLPGPVSESLTGVPVTRRPEPAATASECAAGLQVPLAASARDPPGCRPLPGVGLRGPRAGPWADSELPATAARVGPVSPTRRVCRRRRSSC